MFKSAPTAMFLASFVLLAGVASRAQDMTGLDVTSDAFTKSRDEPLRHRVRNL